MFFSKLKRNHEDDQAKKIVLELENAKLRDQVQLLEFDKKTLSEKVNQLNHDREILVGVFTK